MTIAWIKRLSLSIIGTAILITAISGCGSSCCAGEEALPPAIKLEKPDTTGGMPLMQALAERHSERQYADKDLSLEHLSGLLWAVNGINRQNGNRTVPTAMNRQEIDVYVFLKSGVYYYNPKENQLEPVAAGDQRAATGSQDFVAKAPVNLVYVSNGSRVNNDTRPASERLYSAMNIGHCSQSAYLYAASNKMAAVIRGMVDASKLATILKLNPNSVAMAAQSVGYAVEK